MIAQRALWVAALFVEAERLLGHLGLDGFVWEEKESFYLTQVQIGSLSVTFLVTGMGGDRAELAAENHLNEDREYDYALALGFAGGLVKTSRPGDLVLPSSVQFKEDRFRPCPEIYGRFLQSAKARPEESSVLSVLGSVERVLGKPAEKAAFHAATGAQAVDLEVAAWAKTFERFRIPWVAVKAILDSPSEEISQELLEMSDVYGRVSSSHVLGTMLRHPSSLIDGLRFKKRIQDVSTTYAAVVEDFLKAEEDRKQANDPAIGGEDEELSGSNPLQEEEKGHAPR